MSPRRDSADVERLGKEARQTLQEWVNTPWEGSFKCWLRLDKPKLYSCLFKP
jgi:hypothetical protein